MFNKIEKAIMILINVFAIGFVILFFVYFGYCIYGLFAAPYIISADRNDYFIKEYREEDGYYYVTTICGNECKIPTGIAVVKKNK